MRNKSFARMLVIVLSAVFCAALIFSVETVGARSGLGTPIPKSTIQPTNTRTPVPVNPVVPTRPQVFSVTATAESIQASPQPITIVQVEPTKKVRKSHHRHQRIDKQQHRRIHR